MANFHRDTDLNAFNRENDITAATVSRSSASASPSKPSTLTAQSNKDTYSISRTIDNDDEKDEAALASLRKRMAGPSSSKAGLSVDQDEINRKIYEASKGSKFFENEKRSDARTTRQIEAMLAKRDKLLSHFPQGSEPWQATERRIDEHVMTLESHRDLSRIILHADMDMFYAAVELKRDPSLKGKAFGVGKGVLVTASYEARKMGCRSGMATHVALALCPHLIVVANDMASYVAASQQVMAIFEQYDPNYAQMSLDEAYLDLTPYCEMNNCNADAVVTELREAVQRQTGLTVSVGIAPNKMLAKISSDRNKPNGQFRVEPDRNFIIDLMQDLPCRKIPGIGRVTERILSSLGVNTCGDIWQSRVMLHLTLGDIDWILNAYLGIHSNVVEPAKRGERKSVGREHTFRPTKDTTQLKDFLRQSADQVAKDLERLDFRGKCITLTCKTDTFQRFTRAKTMTSYQYKAADLYQITSKLLDAEIAARGGPFAMRLIGVRISSLKDLREPENGGIKKMFEQGRTSPRKKARMELDKAQGAQNEETLSSQQQSEMDFERAMERALQESADEAMGKNGIFSSASSSDLMKDGIVTDHTLLQTEESCASCPVCNAVIRIHIDEKADEHTFNALLNEQIDRCLDGQGHQATFTKNSAPSHEGHTNVSTSKAHLAVSASSAKKRKKESKKVTLDSFFRQPKA